MKTAFRELEKRGLVCYGLRFNHEFTSDADLDTNGLIVDNSGHIKAQLSRDIDKYGLILGKGKYKNSNSWGWKKRQYAL